MKVMIFLAATWISHLVSAYSPLSLYERRKITPSGFLKALQMPLGNGGLIWWHQSTECVESREKVMEVWPFMNGDMAPDFERDFQNRKGPQKRICWDSKQPPLGLCFRGIFESFITRHKAQLLATLIPTLDARQENRLFDEVVSDTIALFAEAYGIESLTLSAYDFIQGDAGDDDAAWDDQSHGWGKMHSDFKYREYHHDEFLYSALLYLTDSTMEEGGGTGFVNLDDSSEKKTFDEELFKKTGGKYVQDGLYVFPSVGRLAIFSGGMENLHGAMPHTRKHVDSPRKILAMWFTCPLKGETGSKKGKFEL